MMRSMASMPLGPSGIIIWSGVVSFLSRISTFEQVFQTCVVCSQSAKKPRTLGQQNRRRENARTCPALGIRNTHPTPAQDVIAGGLRHENVVDERVDEHAVGALDATGCDVRLVVPLREPAQKGKAW